MYAGRCVSVIIAAAGSGSRMRSAIPKQLIKINGKPMLIKTTEAFEQNASVDDIIIVVDRENLNNYREVFSKYAESSGRSFTKLEDFVIGGKTRQESVRSGLDSLPEHADIVLIHDGARPFVSDQCIENVIRTVYEKGAATVVVPVIDTVKTVENGKLKSTFDRDVLYAVQTPQGFLAEIITTAHIKACEDGFEGTDDAVLAERIGYDVFPAKGDFENIKITVPEDLSKHQNDDVVSVVDVGEDSYNSITRSAVNTADTGTEEIADTGMVEMVETGAAETTDIGTEEMAETEMVETGVAETTDTGTGEITDTGMVEMVETGAAETTDIGTEEMAETEMVETGVVETTDKDAVNTTEGLRAGIGFDVHRLVQGRKLILAGVEIEQEIGLIGHSDADVAIHALIDAMLGAAALGDIGGFFPDTDLRYKDISSLTLLEMTMEVLRLQGFMLVNTDITIIAEKPKLAPYIGKMRRVLAETMGMDISTMSIKATTTEGMGFCGREEGIAALAVVQMMKNKGL